LSQFARTDRRASALCLIQPASGRIPDRRAFAIVTMLGANYFFMKAMPLGTSWDFERSAAAQRQPVQ
jgi:hypothetical protein